MKTIIDRVRRNSQKAFFNSKILVTQGYVNLFKSASNKIITNINEHQGYFLNKCNIYGFNSNNKLPDQESKDEKRKIKNQNDKDEKNTKELEDKLQRMIFSPRILLSNLQHMIQNQLEQQLKQLKYKDSHHFNISNPQQQSNQNSQVQQIDINIDSNKKLLKTCYLLRNFITSVLQLDKQIAVMNEVDHDEDYKLDTTFKIIQQIYSLHKMFQSQLQTIISQQAQLSQKTYKKTILLQWCQIINLIKLLQLAPNDKSFNFIKFVFYYKTWKQRLEYFVQGLPLGVHIRFFGKAVKFSQEILNNIIKIQRMKVENKGVQNFQMELIIETLLNTTYQQFIDSQGINFQNQQQKLNQYINTYKKQLDQYHTKKLKIKKTQNAPPPTKSQQFFSSYSQQKRDFSKDKEFIIQQRQRRIQVNFEFVQLCVLTMLSRQIQHQDKIDRLNDYRNAVHRQYEKYSELKQKQKQSGKLQQKNYQEQTKRYNADRRKRNKFLQQYVRFDKLIAKNFMEYMRANIVGTWTIYRAEDLAKHQFFKNRDNTNKK